MTTNKQLRELAEKATPGPWGWDGPVWGYDAENDAPWLIQEQGSGVVITGEPQCSEANAEYIAAASPEVITALLDENEALQAECEKLRKDAARWRFVAQFMQLEDVGDDQYCLGLSVDHETLEEMVTVQAARLDVERRRLEWADVQGPEDSPKTLPPITLEEAIDVAIAAQREEV